VLDLLRSPIRATAFLTKEIYDVLRQPRLILTLAFGPFLILLLFGIGFRNEPRPFRTLFVAAEADTLGQQIEEFATTLGPQLIYEGITNDRAAAERRLRGSEVDLVIVVPENAEETIRNNEQAVFTLLHNEIDPLQAGYVDYFGQIYVGEVNRRIVQDITAQGQSEATRVLDDLFAAHTAATAMREALERGDRETAGRQQDALSNEVGALELALGASMGLLRGVGNAVGGSGETETSAAILEQLAAIRENTNNLDNLPADADLSAEVEQARAIETELSEMEAMLSEFTSISPGVIVSPFRSEARSVANLTPDITHYFAPGVLVLLLQHIAVTFGALSVVRERQTGTVELFRVAPISPGEVLTGKYLSFLLFAGLLTAVLTLLLRYALGVPMVGNWGAFILVITLLLLASLGIGFVISLISDTDSHAVQLAMLVLLASVFFSGIFTALYLLWEPIRVISWMLPVTYGIQLLQAIMLRGAAPSPLLLGGLLAISLVVFLWAWFLMRGLMARR
jgi:ABC-2 type transport system permease protein